MRIRFCNPLAMTLILGLLCNGAAAQPPAADAVASRVESLRLAMVAGDSAALSGIVTEELNYGHSNGAIDTKRDFVSKLANGVYDFVTIQLSSQSIQLVGKTALVRHQLDADTNDGGKPGKVRLHVLTVWTKKGGGWYLLARQAARLPL